MRKSIYTTFGLLIAGVVFGQEETNAKDTTRMNFGPKTEVIIVTKQGDEVITEDIDTIQAGGSCSDVEESLTHWQGIEVGFNTLMNNEMKTSFANHPYWNIDPAKSIYLNFNFWSHKFDIVKEYVGITTGAGFNFNSFGFKDNYLLTSSPDSVYAVMDTVNEYSKNKLKASYFQVPLLLEFNTSKNKDKCFFLTTGVIGGVRLGSKVKREISTEEQESKYKKKGTYGLSSFKLDATVRLGYGSWGAFANYGIIPLFDVNKTDEIHPITFGLTYSF